MSVNAARKQRRKVAAKNMEKESLQSATEAGAAAKGDMPTGKLQTKQSAAEAEAEAEAATTREMATKSLWSTAGGAVATSCTLSSCSGNKRSIDSGGIMQAARRVLVETMQVGSMEEARQHVAPETWQRQQAYRVGTGRKQRPWTRRRRCYVYRAWRSRC